MTDRTESVDPIRNDIIPAADQDGCTTLFQTNMLFHKWGTIRLSEWPDGLVLWIGGEIRYRSWKDPEMAGFVGGKLPEPPSVDLGPLSPESEPAEETVVLNVDQFGTLQELFNAIYSLPGMADKIDAFLRGRGFDDPHAELESLRKAAHGEEA